MFNRRHCPKCGGMMTVDRIVYSGKGIIYNYVCEECGYRLTVEYQFFKSIWKKKYWWTAKSQAWGCAV